MDGVLVRVVVMVYVWGAQWSPDSLDSKEWKLFSLILSDSSVCELSPPLCLLGCGLDWLIMSLISRTIRLCVRLIFTFYSAHTWEWRNFQGEI